MQFFVVVDIEAHRGVVVDGEQNPSLEFQMPERPEVGHCGHPELPDVTLSYVAQHRGPPGSLSAPRNALAGRRLRRRSVETDRVGIVIFDETLFPTKQEPGLLDHCDDQVGCDLTFDTELRKAIVDEIQQRDFVLQLEAAGGDECGVD